MRITGYTDYSLRVLMYVTAQGNRLATIQEIADRYGISKNHLMKVVHQLTRKGYLESVRGKKGGIRLKPNPSDINLGILVREMEPDLHLVECFGPDNTCVITPICSLKGVLNEALQAFLATLDQYTLADITPSSDIPQLIRLLNIPTEDAAPG
ncbi:BadM/Rrf2 family transcriptional regulator [Halospina denitrificans]|uniref:BadM/Rrf2 family transcriptional regulator n=1 Tax=Halospina denitrificans TaxID=332522 RepID=A0A4R7K1P9_9GAMM|nr:Rrf2 family transcriptional regulator [Halospina denitrificans]TDT44284.1 BadM/Rrf2 family transcriptional regulator [Halospina denitrificans]